MGKATGFQFDKDTGDIRMNAGDTGSFKVHCARKSGDEWPATARCLFTIKNQNGETVMQRIYRLDDQYDLGDGIFLVEFHNDDTDDWAAGDYSMERRYDLEPVWDGTAPTGRCVDALTAAAKMIEGVPVRTVFVGTLHIDGVLGRI